MSKQMCTDHEELYKNLLKPQMKVGNELVAQVSNKSRVNTVMQTLVIMPDIQYKLCWFQIAANQE